MTFTEADLLLSAGTWPRPSHPMLPIGNVSHAALNTKERHEIFHYDLIQILHVHLENEIKNECGR
jgi:hypothetical protein